MTDETGTDAVIEMTRDQILKEYADGTMAVRMLIEPRNIKRFIELFPGPGIRCAVARLVESHERPRIGQAKPVQSRKGEYGALAYELRKYHNWMGNPKVWASFGTDEEYCEWLRDQPCAFCGRKPDWVMEEFVRNECAHVRRVANGAGEAIRPPFSAIPLCTKDHRAQHQHGESAVGGKEWFDRQRMKHLYEWLWWIMKVTFSVDSMSDLQPELLVAYARDAGLERCLPDCYQGG